MKKIFLSIAAALSMTAATAQNGYKITGTVDDCVVPGDTIYLCNVQGFFSFVPEDTTIVQAGNKFEFTGNFDGLTTRYVLPIHNGMAVATAEVMLENADIEMQIFKDEKKNVMKGGPAYKLYKEYEAGKEVYERQIEKPWAIVMDSTTTKEAKAVAQATVDSLSALRDAYTKKYIVENIPSPVCDMLFIYHQKLFTEAEQEDVLKRMGEGHHYYYYNLLMAERAATARTAVGQQYTDLAMPGPDGKTVKASDYVGKNRYTLIDFWASWCGPCRAEMPNVVKAYDLYHAKGFEVVGISFDNNKDAWVKALTQLKMPWPQMSDLKGWDCAAAPLYNVKGIPANVLVDQSGKIVAKNLRDKDLLDTLEKLMK